MDFLDTIRSYTPKTAQEAADQAAIVEFATHFSSTVLLRQNKIAHITSSGFILNPSLNKVLLVHHNIRKAWGWTGGHADGNGNLLQVALQEAKEETGAKEILPLSGQVASIDILPVNGHYKNGQYINAHLHLSVAYILVCDETQALAVKPDENSAVGWFSTSWINENNLSAPDVDLYNKLVTRAHQWQNRP